MIHAYSLNPVPRRPQRTLWPGVVVLLAALSGCPAPGGSGSNPNGNAPPANQNSSQGNDNGDNGNESVANANGDANGNGNANGNPNANGAGNGNGSGAVEAVFPDNYRETFTEVRDCRMSIEHGPFMIRVLANDIALQPYLNNENPLPVGSVLVKEEFLGTDCSNLAELAQWRVMRKEPPGFDPEDGDWHWQLVLAPARTVADNSKRTCIGCHSLSECLERDYQCTEP